MFDSLKHWFDSLKEESKLFEHREDEILHSALATEDVHGDLHTINFYLKRNPAVRMTFMRKLMQLVDVHGTHGEELELFFETLHEVFPEIREIRGDADL
jgi:hypothetical protein